MKKPLQYAGQAVFFVAVAALIGHFSKAPTYQTFDDTKALIRLSFTHSGEREVECRKLSREEIAKLPPNMRKSVSCPRRRVPVVVELVIDGEEIYSASLPSSGLSGDGPSRVYEAFPVEAGPHHIIVRVRDSRRTEGFDYTRESNVVLKPREKYVVDFRSEQGIVFY